MEKKPEKVDPLPETVRVEPAARPNTGRPKTVLTAKSTAREESFAGPSKPFTC